MAVLLELSSVTKRETHRATIRVTDDNDRAQTIMRAMIRAGIAVHTTNESARTQDDGNEVNAGSSMIVMPPVILGTLPPARLANVSHAVSLICRSHDEKLHALSNSKSS